MFRTIIKAITPISATISILAFCFCASPSIAQTQGRARVPAGQQAGPARAAQADAATTEQSKNAAPVSAGLMKSTAADRRSVEVTIYNSHLGLVKEQRKISTGAGQGELQFIDVPAQINPVTVHIKPLANAADFSVLEQNYEYDLISHAKLMDKYIGKQIKIVEWNDYQDRKKVVDAVVLGGMMHSGEVFKIDNEIYLGHPGTKVLPELPGNLISRPTLSWIYRSAAAREYQLEVSYLTGGMNWNADYILVVGSGNSGAGLSGWVTVNNQSGAAFEDAKLKLVAGDVNRVRPQASFRSADMGYGGTRMAMAAEPEFAQSEVFEYYMYDLQRPTTIKDNQTKQINLMEAHGVTVVKEYTTASGFTNFSRQSGGRAGDPVKQPVSAFFSFKNSKENKLGSPLPAGTIRLYTADAGGSQQFIGEDRINHTPKDETVRLKAGEAFDIVAERQQLDYQQKTAQMFETEWLITLRNRKNEDIVVGVLETAHGQWSVIESTHKHTKVNATTLRFDIPVATGKEVSVKYKLRTGQ